MNNENNTNDLWEAYRKMHNQISLKKEEIVIKKKIEVPIVEENDDDTPPWIN